MSNLERITDADGNEFWQPRNRSGEADKDGCQFEHLSGVCGVKPVTTRQVMRSLSPAQITAKRPHLRDGSLDYTAEISTTSTQPYHLCKRHAEPFREVIVKVTSGKAAA